MIKNSKFLLEWQTANDRGPPDVAQNRRLFEGLYRLARSLGALSSVDGPMDHKIALARALNVRVATRQPR